MAAICVSEMYKGFVEHIYKLLLCFSLRIILNSMRILDQKKIKQKIKRLAIEIIENNYNEKEIIIAGINNNGHGFAKLILRQLRKLSADIKFTTARVTLDPAKPLSTEVTMSIPPADYKGKVVILIDDVANTGRTTFFAFKPFMEVLTKKIEVAVLVNRKHKLFPIKVDYVGVSLATTLKENIEVRLLDVEEMEVWLV